MLNRKGTVRIFYDVETESVWHVMPCKSGG
jgi:hypothetical protein